MNKNLISKKILNSINELKDQKKRKENNQTFAEGINILKSCLENNVEIKYLIVDKNQFNKNKEIYEKVNDSKIYYLDEQTLSRLSSTKTSYSCITVFKIPDIITEISKKNINNPNDNFLNEIKQYLNTKSYITGLYQISDPGNLGTIIRTSIGFKQDNMIIFSPHCDPFSPKVIRSTSGAIFKIKKIFCIDEDVSLNFLDIIKNKSIRIVLAEKTEGNDIISKSNIFPSLIIFGNEGRGFDSRIRNLKDISFTIPQSNDIESYNLSVSHGIISFALYSLLTK